MESSSWTRVAECWPFLGSLTLTCWLTLPMLMDSFRCVAINHSPIANAHSSCTHFWLCLQVVEDIIRNEKIQERGKSVEEKVFLGRDTRPSGQSLLEAALKVIACYLLSFKFYVFMLLQHQKETLKTGLKYFILGASCCLVNIWL